MRSLDRLMLTVGLLDRITGPLRGIQRTVDQVTTHSRRAFMNTAAGVTALISASAAFATTINPANDMNQALGEVRSLEVAESTLASLNQEGLKYSIQFGDQASNYVRSAYDIQSAIDGLVDNDLPRFTTAAGTLAKATKANVSDITSYFGSMYGIFKNQANEMGKGTWVEMLAGQTATAVQMFKTTGPEMSAAFESIGADAQSMGIKLSEQMGVLGTLQSTMSGSEAGTKYGAFLGSLGNAQEKLDLKFTDQSGALLPVVEILDKIKTQTNGLGALETQNLLSDAFGSDEAVSFIQLMSADIGKLTGDINKLGKVKGMEKAIWMAEQMQDPWARLGSGIQAVSIAVWQKALPAINPFVDAMTQVSLVIVEWTDKYPHLTKAIGLGATAFMGLIAVAGLMTIAIGLVQFAGVGLTMRFLIIRPVVWAARAVMMAYTASLWLMRTALLAFVLYGPAVSAFFMVMKAGFLSSLPAVWSFTAALLANPLVWIIIGLYALGASLVALVVYWDDITAAIGRFSKWVVSGLSQAWDAIKGFFNALPKLWESLSSGLSNIDWLALLKQGLLSIVGGLVGVVTLIVDSIVNTFKGVGLGVEWVLGAISSGWSGLKNVFENNEWMKVVFFPIYGAILAVENLIDTFDLISQWWSGFSAWFSGLTLLPSWNIGTDVFEPLTLWWSDFSAWFAGLTLLPSWDIGTDIFEPLTLLWSDFSAWFAGLSLLPNWDISLNIFEPLALWWSDFSAWFTGLTLLPNWEISLEIFEPLTLWWTDFSAWFSGLTLLPDWDISTDIFELIPQWWGEFSVWFTGLTLLPTWEISTDIFEPLKAWWGGFTNWLSDLNPFSFLDDSISSMKEKLSWIPGIDLDSTTEVKQKIESEQSSMNSVVTLPGSESTQTESEGGLFQTISNLFGGSSKSTHIEKIEVNNQGQPMRGDELAHEMEMQVG